MRKKFEDDTKEIDKKDKELLQDVKDGKITKDEYFAWRVKVNLKLQKQAKKMAELLDKADEDAKDIANNEIPKKYTQSYNRQGYDTEKVLSIETDFEVQNVEAIQQAIAGRFYAKYDKAANDRYNRRRLSSMITAGIIQGKSMQDIAKDIRPLCDSNRKSAIRNARTWVTGAENGGRHDAALRMKELGVKERKIWLAVTDMRTRFSHRALDEEIKEIDEPFSNGGMYPADPKLPPEERYNCRCSYRVLPDGFNPDMNVRHVDIGGMSYDEWKQGKERKQKQQTKQGVYGLPPKPIRPKASDYGGIDSEAYQQAKAEYRKKKDEYDRALNALVDSEVNRTTFNTFDEAKKWASKQGIIFDDSMKNIDLRAFNSIKPAMDKMFSMFPEMRGYKTEDFTGTPYTRRIRFQAQDANDFLMEASGGITFSTRYFKDYREAVKSQLSGMSEGFNVKGNGLFETAIMHEFGHNVQSYITHRIEDKYHTMADDWRVHFSSLEEAKEAQSKELAEYRKMSGELDDIFRKKMRGKSEYANTNTLELFAEGFAEHVSGANSEFAKEFGKFLKRWYK